MGWRPFCRSTCGGRRKNEGDGWLLARFSIAGVPHNGIRIVSSSNWLASDALAGGKLGRGHRLPPYPGAPVFVHNFLTYDQFNWMDYASFSMTGKVRVTVTMLVSERKVLTCRIDRKSTRLNSSHLV